MTFLVARLLEGHTHDGQVLDEDIKCLAISLYSGEFVSCLWQPEKLTLTHSAGLDTVRLSPWTFMSCPGVLTLLLDHHCTTNIFSSHAALSGCISQGPRGNRSRHWP
jgi:hypothetical protein